MNATFETIRKELKKYNAEDNEVPPKLVVAGKHDFLAIEHMRKRNSQFIIGIKEFYETEKFLVEQLLLDLEKRSGGKPLAFVYNDREKIEAVIADFNDYYNMTLNRDVFQTIESSTGPGPLQFCLIIVVIESFYYKL